MAPIYSSALIREIMTPGGVATLPIPAGKTCVVREIMVGANTDVTFGNGIDVEFLADGVQFKRWTWGRGFSGDLIWSGRVVAVLGLAVNMNGPGTPPVAVYVGGYLLG